MSPAKHSFGKCDRRTDRRTDGQTDDGQSDPYVSLCFAGDTKSTVSHPPPQMAIFTTRQHNFSPYAFSVHKTQHNGKYRMIPLVCAFYWYIAALAC